MTEQLTDQQRNRERSIRLAIVMDSGMISTYLLIAILSGSLTMAAEVIRGVLLLGIEAFALAVMKRIHRGRTAILEFGAGKLEQIVNVLIATGLLAGALWIGFGVVRILIGDKDVGSPAGFALAAIFASTNTYVNILAWDSMRRAARGGGSLIMKGQLQARTVKLMSSLFVQLTLTVAALSNDSVVIAWADAIGATFVCGYIIHSAIDMLRAGLPDLVDRTAHEGFQAAINRMLAKHFDDFERLDRVRTRRAGEIIYAEIALAFRTDLSIGEVNRRIDAMRASLREEIPEADVSILATSC